MPNIKFDWTLNLSSLSMLIVMIGGGVATVTTMQSNWTLVLSRIDSLEQSVKAIGGIVVEQGKMAQWQVDFDHRMTALESWRDRMQQGAAR